MKTRAFCGIDVAFAKGKRLPICVCVKETDGLRPLPLRDPPVLQPPRGRGNRKSLEPDVVQQFAQETLEYLREVERRFEVKIVRVGIDAPRLPKQDDAPHRAADHAMAERGISCFSTPSAAQFQAIAEKARAHIASDGREAHMPHANQLWMLVGFALFRILCKEGYECLEVYPQATVRTLGCCRGSKFTKAGLDEQYEAATRATGWVDKPLDLARAVFGPRHDRLDAYLAAWVASLPEEKRQACGCPPYDVIWIPATIVTTNR